MWRNLGWEWRIYWIKWALRGKTRNLTKRNYILITSSSLNHKHCNTPWRQKQSLKKQLECIEITECKNLYTNLRCLTSIEAFALQKREFRIRHVCSYYNLECIVNNIKIRNSVPDSYGVFFFFFYKYFQSILLNRHSLNILLSTICSKSQKESDVSNCYLPLISIHASCPVTWNRIQNQFPFHRKKVF